MLKRINKQNTMGSPTTTLLVGKAPSEECALSNCLIMNPTTHHGMGSPSHLTLNHIFHLSVITSLLMEPGSIGTSGVQRKWMQLALSDEVKLGPLEFRDGSFKNHYIEFLNIEIGFVRPPPPGTPKASFETGKLCASFISKFSSLPFQRGQPLLLDFSGYTLLLKIKDFGGSAGGGKNDAFAIIEIGKTSLIFSKNPDHPIALEGLEQQDNNSIIGPDFRFEDMGIGGLDKEFWTIFRRAFASRIYPQDLIEKLGINHIKGLILYGPPGTGKTLIARQIAKMLNAREPKIVNGPEILNKYVGQSEENIRLLFKEAEAEYKAKGSDSQLHIIIFDELDAICKSRGSSGGAGGEGGAVGDSVVNQLLGKMDGVEPLNNILIIGMTNRLDMFDPALLRPGRFEVQLEIGLPSQEGREQILRIHTHKMTSSKILSLYPEAEDGLDLGDLAKRSKNFTGAELVGLVNSATSFALNRHIKVDNEKGGHVTIDKVGAQNIHVLKDDFYLALSEVTAAFGADQEEFQGLKYGGVDLWSEEMKTIYGDAQLVLKHCSTSTQESLLTGILLYGSNGCGKSSFASKLCIESGFPFVKHISPHLLVGMSESAKVQTIKKVFMDAYKSPLSIIMLDDLEDICEWVSVGPSFSVSLLQSIRSFMKKAPPPNRKLLVIATTSNRALLERLGLSPLFRHQLYLPNIQNRQQFSRVCLLSFDDGDDGDLIVPKIMSTLPHSNVSFSIPVKDLLELLEILKVDLKDTSTNTTEDGSMEQSLARFSRTLEQYFITTIDNQ